MQTSKPGFLGIAMGLNLLLCLTSSCEKSQTATPVQKWEQTQTTDFIGDGRQNAVTFSIGSKGYVGLGNQGENIVFTDLWEFNPTDKTWARKKNFPGI